MCVVRTAFTSQISFSECIWFGFCDFTEAYQPSQFQDSLFSLFSSQDTTSRLLAFYRRFSAEKFHYSQFLNVITYLNKLVIFIKQTSIQLNVKCLRTKTIISTFKQRQLHRLKIYNHSDYFGWYQTICLLEKPLGYFLTANLKKCFFIFFLLSVFFSFQSLFLFLIFWLSLTLFSVFETFLSLSFHLLSHFSEFFHFSYLQFISLQVLCALFTTQNKRKMKSRKSC